VWVGNFEGDSMRDVSGVTGAAPAWAELMDALQRGFDSGPPQAPEGVTATTVAFTPAVEAPRREWFMADTQNDRVQGVPPAAALARIASPSNATVIALDPDIPPAAQRVPIRARGAVSGLRFRLNDRVIGDAAGTVLWAPKSGLHRLVLEDGTGRTLDRVQFIVR
jgi:penicillin-binding protein 1C